MTCETKLYYDLHIHSVLSPCADDLMTPNNLVNMSMLKGLDFISVTDHNSADNLMAIASLCEEQDVVLIPGIEVESKEGVHLLCYFQMVDTALKFSEDIAAHLMNIKNNETLFGHQWVMNAYDDVIASKEVLLLQSCSLSVEEIVAQVISLEGLVFAAHINRQSHSILTHLGFIPPTLELTGVELNRDIYERQGSKEVGYKHVLINSDAHTIDAISERVYYISGVEKSKQGFFSYFKEA